MAYDALLEEVEKEFEGFTLDDEDDEYGEDKPEALREDAFHCRDAHLFYTWCSKVVGELRQHPTEEWIDTHEVYLQRRYWEWLKRVSSECRGYWAEYGEAKCINDIWFETMSAITDIRLLQKPLVFKEKEIVEVAKSEKKVTIGAIPLFMQ